MTPPADRRTSVLPERLARWNEWKIGLGTHMGPWTQWQRGRIWDILGLPEPERARAFRAHETYDPVRFDADEWVDVMKRAGIRYAVFTAKHHDGFCNWNTATTRRSIMSPDCPYSRHAKVDPVRAFLDACRSRDLPAGLYFSHIDWSHPDGEWGTTDGLRRMARGQARFPIDYPDRWQWFATYQTEQVRELLEHSGPIDILWWDIWWPPEGFADAVPMFELARALHPTLIMSNRGTEEYNDPLWMRGRRPWTLFLDFGDRSSYGDYLATEEAVPDDPPPHPWEAILPISNGDGYWYKGPQDTCKSPTQIVRLIAEVCSKGGNLQLYAGVRPDGTLVPDEVDCLTEVGRWLEVNAEAVYGTERSPLAAAPEWGRITRRGERIYCLVLDPPRQGFLTIDLDPRSIRSAALLATGRPVEVRPHGRGGAELLLPPDRPHDDATVVALDTTVPR